MHIIIFTSLIYTPQFVSYWMEGNVKYYLSPEMDHVINCYKVFLFFTNLKHVCSGLIIRCNNNKVIFSNIKMTSDVTTLVLMELRVLSIM